MITKEQAEIFINNYGTGDVFYSYKVNNKMVEIQYFPHMANFVSSESVEDFIANFNPELENNKNLLRTIVLCEDYAKIVTPNKKMDKTLEHNYSKFLQDIEEKTF